MSRPLNPTLIDVLQSRRGWIVFFVAIEADGGTERFWTGFGTVNTGGHNWTGAGNLAVIEGVDEGTELSPYACRFGLNGLSQTIIDLVLQEELFNRPCSLWISATTDKGVVVSNPDYIFRGRIRDVDAQIGGPDGDLIMITAESELIDFERSPGLVYTDSQQQTRYPGDLGFQYIGQVLNSVTVWRGSQTRVGGGYLNRGGGPSRDGRRDAAE